jgi:hypothetical protein
LGLQRHLAHLLAAAAPVAPALALAFVLAPVKSLAPRLAIACVAHGFPRPAAAAASSSLAHQRSAAFNLPPPAAPGPSGHSDGAVSVSGAVSPEFTLAGVNHLVFGVALSLQHAWASLAGGAPEPLNLPPLAAHLLDIDSDSSSGEGPDSSSSSCSSSSSAGGNGNSGKSGTAGVAWAGECGRAVDFFALLAADEPAWRRALAADRGAAGKETAGAPRFSEAQWRALWRHGGPRRGAGTAAAFEAAWKDAAPV